MSEEAKKAVLKNSGKKHKKKLSWSTSSPESLKINFLQSEPPVFVENATKKTFGNQVLQSEWGFRPPKYPQTWQTFK